MDDRRLSQLLRMAAEAERLEEQTLPFVSPARAAAGPSWRMWAGVGSAAAAVVVIAAVWMANALSAPASTRVVATTTGSERTPPPVITHRIEPAVLTPTAAADPCESESTVLLAIFRKADGATSTMRVAMKDWDSRRGINDLAEGELIGFAFEHQEDLTPDTMPDSVVLLAVSGPSELVPRSDEAAAHLAACLEQAPTTCGEEMPCYTNAALQCLPAGLSVQAEARVVR